MVRFPGLHLFRSATAEPPWLMQGSIVVYRKLFGLRVQSFGLGFKVSWVC